MNQLHPVQKWLYFLGEMMLIASLLWGGYHWLTSGGSCPASVFNFITLLVASIAVTVLALIPLGPAAYLAPWLRKSMWLAYLWWALAVAGVGYSLYLRLSHPVPAQWWAYALIPAVAWYWFAVPSRSLKRGKPPAKAEAAPADAGAEQPEEGQNG